jgi:tripartite-type tricarboxylate transporter receptor subunit TctC
MRLARRRFLRLAAAAFAAPVLAQGARALDYPTRPVHLVVSAAAGNTTDIIARLIGQRLSERLGQPFIIENRPGAGSNIGTEAVVRAPADGYTILLISMGNFINATLYEKLAFNFASDIAPVASIMRSPNVMEIDPSLPVATVSDFIAYAKRNPGRINFASPGIGTSVHVAGEMFKPMADVDMVHVPYRGTAAALTDLMSGEVQVMFDNLPSSIEHIRSRRLRLLAVTAATRWAGLPGVPTIAETVPGYEATVTAGIGVPKDTPIEIIRTLNREINAGLADPMVAARLADLGAEPFALSPGQYRAFIAEETAKWAKVVRASGAKAD